MVKIAAIDCGSNSTRLLIADVSSGALSPLYKTHQVTKTSEGVEADNNISQDAKNRLIKTLRGYLKKINSENVDQIIITGTAVFRDADNSEAVIEEIRKKLDLEIQIISGEEEGFLTSLGVLSSSNIKDNFFIVDIRLLIEGVFLSNSNDILSGIKLYAIMQLSMGVILSKGFI